MDGFKFKQTLKIKSSCITKYQSKLNKKKHNSFYGPIDWTIMSKLPFSSTRLFWPTFYCSHTRGIP